MKQIVSSIANVQRAFIHRMHMAIPDRNDRGDVPGWVLVAVMTAGLVTAIWLIADDALTSVFDRAMTSVSVRN